MNLILTAKVATKLLVVTLRSIKGYVGYNVTLRKRCGRNAVIILNSFLSSVAMLFLLYSIVFEIKMSLFIGLVLITLLLLSIFMAAVAKEYNLWLARKI